MATAASTYYIGFNMLDNTVGGNSVRSKYLRQAISLAIDYEEYISIFTNGRGIVAQKPNSTWNFWIPRWYKKI